MLDLNKIYCMDCLDGMREIPDNSIDCIITDPPFAFTGGISNGSSSNISSQFFLHWWRDVCRELTRILKPDAEGFIWCDWKTAAIIQDGFTVKKQTYDVFRVSQMLYHYREMPGQGNPFRSSVDMIAYLRGPKSTGERISRDTHNFISKYWYYGKHDNHPSEKDPQMGTKLLEWCSDKEDVMIDPFCGGGSFCIAAKETGRYFIGMDLDEDFTKIAQSRCDLINPITKDSRNWFEDISI